MSAIRMLVNQRMRKHGQKLLLGDLLRRNFGQQELLKPADCDRQQSHMPDASSASNISRLLPVTMTMRT